MSHAVFASTCSSSEREVGRVICSVGLAPGWLESG